MIVFTCKADGSCSRASTYGLAGPATKQDAGISASVGRGGANRVDDVYTVQKLLNAIPEGDGGPRPVLDEDGKCGSLTRAAIKQFQEQQFPDKVADARVDPNGRTLTKLNELNSRGRPDVSTNQYIEMANALAPEALRRVSIARRRLNAATADYKRGYGAVSDNRRLTDWHFKVHRAEDPIQSIAAVERVYARMSNALSNHIAGNKLLFEAGFAFTRDQAVMYSIPGGYFCATGDVDENVEDKSTIKVVGGASPNTIIHELGHYCGGSMDSASWIGHVANPVPMPNGTRLEDSLAFHDYMQMQPEEALRNCASFQALATPNPWNLGPPLTVGEW